MYAHIGTFIISLSASICWVLGDRCNVIRLATVVGASLSSVRRLEAQGRGSVEMFVKKTQALQAVQQLKLLLTQREVSITELEKQQAKQHRRRVWP